MNKSRIAAAVSAALTLGALAPAVHADGAALFEEHCSACHSPGGVGTPGLAPPLNLTDFWQGLGDRAPSYISGVLMSGLTGKINAGGVDYIALAMPAQEQLTDDEAAEVASYVLSDLGQTKLAVTPAEIAATRAAPPSHADLRKIRKGE